MDAARALGALTYALILASAAWQDLRRGEVDARLLAALALAGVLGLALATPTRPSLAVLALAGALGLALNRAGWMGGADLVALASLAAAVPSHPLRGPAAPLPFPVGVLLLALLLGTVWAAVRGFAGVLRSGRAARALLVTAGAAAVAGSTLGVWDLALALDLVLAALLVRYLGRLAARGGAPDPAGEVRFLPALLASLLLHLALGDPLGMLFKVI